MTSHMADGCSDDDDDGDECDNVYWAHRAASDGDVDELTRAINYDPTLLQQRDGDGECGASIEWWRLVTHARMRAPPPTAICTVLLLSIPSLNPNKHAT